MPARRQKDQQGISALPDTSSQPSQRLDRWLWFTRVTKSRSLAAALISDGKVRVNKVRVTKPAHSIKSDDVVTITVHRQVRVLRMLEPGKRRGPAAEAQLLYEDLSPPPEPRDAAQISDQQGEAGNAIPQAAAPIREPGTGRPTKRERRSLDRLRGDDD